MYFIQNSKKLLKLNKRTLQFARNNQFLMLKGSSSIRVLKYSRFMIDNVFLQLLTRKKYNTTTSSDNIFNYLVLHLKKCINLLCSKNALDFKRNIKVLTFEVSVTRIKLYVTRNASFRALPPFSQKMHLALKLVLVKSILKCRRSGQWISQGTPAFDTHNSAHLNLKSTRYPFDIRLIYTCQNFHSDPGGEKLK